MPRDVLLEFFREATSVGDARDVRLAQRRDSLESAEMPFDPGIRLNRIGYRTVLPFVERVVSGSPADLAGIQSDDLILNMNGRAMPYANAYHDRLRALQPGDSIDLVIQRGKAIVSIHIDPEGL